MRWTQLVPSYSQVSPRGLKAFAPPKSTVRPRAESWARPARSRAGGCRPVRWVQVVPSHSYVSAAPFPSSRRPKSTSTPRAESNTSPGACWRAGLALGVRRDQAVPSWVQVWLVMLGEPPNSTSSPRSGSKAMAAR